MSARLLCPSGFSLSGILLCLVVAMGCNAPPGVNPWTDDSIQCNQWTTPSQDSILASNRQPELRQREVPVVQAPYVDPQVPHFPLWWEDPFEDLGDQNKEFSWTCLDYIAIPYSYGRFHVNTIGWPVSAICIPPCTPMVSDGCVPGCEWHDAQKGVSNDPEATPRDFGLHDTVAVASAPAP